MISHTNVTELVSAKIREMILHGELEPGQRLRLENLAKILGVSIMPVREALRELQAEGLVVIYPRRGAMVATLSTAEFRELDRMIEELEVLACKWLAEDWDQLPLEEMRAVLEELEQAESSHDVTRRLKLVRQFRFLIYNATGRQHLVRILSSLYDLTAHYRRVFSEVAEIYLTRFEHYRQIYRACEARDLHRLIQSVRELFAFASNVVVARLSAGALDPEGE